MNKSNADAPIPRPKGINETSIPKFSVLKAYRVQACLSEKIIRKDCLPKKIRLAAGVDVAYFGDLAASAVAVLDYETLELVETQTAICTSKFPYIPTLFAFKELPPALACIQKLTSKPDVFLIDGHGIVHPRRCGLASHLGVAIKKPTIGVAKSRLIGNLEPAYGRVYIVHNGERVGEAVISKEGCRPLYVSIGNMVSLENATKIVRHLTRNNRIPEPILLAHNLAAQQRTKSDYSGESRR